MYTFIYVLTFTPAVFADYHRWCVFLSAFSYLFLFDFDRK